MIDLRKHIICNIPHTIISYYVLSFFWFSYTENYRRLYKFYDNIDTVIWLLSLIHFVFNASLYSNRQKRSLCTMLIVAFLNLIESTFVKNNYYNIYLTLLVVWAVSIITTYGKVEDNI